MADRAGAPGQPARSVYRGPECDSSPRAQPAESRLRYRARFPADVLSATAARISALNAAASTASP